MAMTPRFAPLFVGSLLALFGAACTDALLEPEPVEQTHLDDRLTLRGRVCTAPPNPNGFPVKVVFIIDQSGSMCVSDPPGAQATAGFCEQVETVLRGQNVIPPGVTQPARVRALKRLIAQFAPQPNVQVAVVPFETNVMSTWPDQSTGSRFARPNSALTAYVDGLQRSLGKGTDYQGALATAYGLIASDIHATSEANPELLPRTRYVVVFLTDGTPYPRCSANDDLTAYADPYSPDLTWADSASAVEFCNLIDEDERQEVFGGDNIPGFSPGTDRNQNYQLFSYVDRLMELKEQFNIGDLRLHTVLLFNELAVEACGAICQDIYGQYPNVAPAQYPQAAKLIAQWTLREMAARGNGIYQSFENGDIQQLSLGALDYTSLASPNVMKTLLVQGLSSVPGLEGREVDSDGDGLADASDNAFTFGTNGFLADSDGDCFDDHFEAARQDQGFVPGTDKDTRGCDPTSPLTLDCACRDTDGDGLSQYAEAFAKTRAGLVDSDGDGAPDGIEARYGLDPLARAAAGIDTDGDGIPDLDELRAGSDPTRQDRAFYDRFGYQYRLTQQTLEDGRNCYDFMVSNVQLVTPPSRAGRKQGYNLFKLWFAEAPASGVASDYGVWKTACAWAQYAPPGVREPAGPDISMQDTQFLPPQQLALPDSYLTRCTGIPPQ